MTLSLARLPVFHRELAGYARQRHLIRFREKTVIVQEPRQKRITPLSYHLFNEQAFPPALTGSDGQFKCDMIADRPTEIMCLSDDVVKGYVLPLPHRAAVTICHLNPALYDAEVKR